MPTPTTTRYTIIQTIFDLVRERPGKPFKSKDIRNRILGLESNTLNNHMTFLINEGVIERISVGTYNLISEEALRDVLSYEIDTNVRIRIVQETKLLHGDDVAELNRMVRFGEALRTIDNPLWKPISERIRELANETSRELVYMHKAALFRRLHQRDALNRLGREDREWMENYAKVHFPDHWMLIMAEIDAKLEGNRDKVNEQLGIVN